MKKLRHSQFHFKDSDSIFLEERDGAIINGCLPMDDTDRNLYEAFSAESVSITSWKSGDMPVFSYDSAFEGYMKDRRESLETLERSGLSWFPWDVLRSLPSEFKGGDTLYKSQSSLGSCAGFAFGQGYHSGLLIDIALGQPLRYEPVNPIVTWYLSKNKSLRGGQGIAKMADFVNQVGNFLVKDVGEYTAKVPSNYEQHLESAAAHQSGICVLDKSSIYDQMVLALRSGFAVACGNTRAVSGAKVDVNGLRVAVLGGNWNHATHFVGYRELGGVSYVGWINSHGPRYGVCASDSMPADGCWMRVNTEFKYFTDSCSTYGPPVIVIPEATIVDYSSLRPIVRAELNEKR